jgi:hypothetical protein
MFSLSALDSLVPDQQRRVLPVIFFFFFGSSKGTTDCDWISALQDPFVIISYPVNHIKFGKLPFLLLLGGCSFVLAFPIGALGNLGCNAILYSPSS